MTFLFKSTHNIPKPKLNAAKRGVVLYEEERGEAEMVWTCVGEMVGISGEGC